MRWYTNDAIYDGLLLFGFAIAAAAALVSLFVQAPYGRFASKRSRLSLDPRLGWFLMELPATLSFLFFYLRGPNSGRAVPLVFLAIWLIHYGNRGFVFPCLMRVPRGARASFGLLVVGSGLLVTTLHGYFNGAFIAGLGRHFTAEWLTDGRFVAGLAIYSIGLAVNIHSDAILRNLRTPQEVAEGVKEYRIPYGGAYRWLSSPSYTAELTAWAGWTLATWSLAGVFIFAISAANLVPRAFATQRWYRERFQDYPRERKALIPFVI